MTVWLVRAGFHVEQEQNFLDEVRTYGAWEGHSMDLAALGYRQALI
jgi:hypothetical protein